ncbi:MAG: riboflavin synthase [Firmicutes bacterium]|nr:riboflavin synthase [Bacillota bacterium]
MFTGITEEKGRVISVGIPLVISASKILEDIHLGDSISVNGTCLTVTRFDKNTFYLDVMNETYSRTALGELKAGDYVNLERAMSAGGRYGGHIVSGHIDGTGKIYSLEKDGIATRVTIKTEKKITDLIVEKGSVCLDGVSLTVVDVKDNFFSVSLIPHTAKNTTLLDKKEGESVNIENDILAKYVQKLMGIEKEESGSRLTTEKLSEYGFM